jgi:ribosomal protein S18 acetylase RimI-like enzyme
MLRPSRVIQAIERNPDALWRLMAENTPAAAYERVYGVSLTSLAFPHPLFNFASMADIPAGEEDRAIAAARTFFDIRGMPWEWQVGPGSRPSDLGSLLSAAGFSVAHEVPGMAIDLRGYTSPAIAGIVEATNDTEMAIWLEALLGAYRMPAEVGTIFTDFHEVVGWGQAPIRYFYTVAEGRPAAVSMVFYGSGVAGIYCVGTHPDLRRRGLGERVMHACLGAAVEDGFDTAILHSSPIGVPLYEKLGFKEYCRIKFYS